MRASIARPSCCRGMRRRTSSGSRRSRSAAATWRTFARPGTSEFQTEPLEQQDVVLTLPASFDEVARELTVEAAARAGLPRVVLIEEPQAAFYAWIYKHQDELGAARRSRGRRFWSATSAAARPTSR